MDIKDLNRSQLIMLALLLSFVTSIATGITTVTLMQQAPPSVTVPINSVIRQTVEKIVPVQGKNTVQTIVVKEEDLVVDAIAKNKSAVFSVTKEVLDLEGKVAEAGAGFGFAVSKEGVVVADGLLVQGGQIYYVKNDSGKFKAEFLYLDKNGFSLLKVGSPLDEKSKLSFTVPSFGDISKMKIGQKILILGNTISSFIYEGGESLKLDITRSGGGSVVFDLDGEVLGIALSSDTHSFVPSNLILESLNPKEVLPENTQSKTP